MNETLLQKIEKLEEKMMQLLTEHEDSRRENQRLIHRIISLETERETHEKKLEDLISLLETAGMDAVNNQVQTGITIPSIKPALVQGG